MKRITLCAYLRHNLGDDLMVHLLLNRYPKLQFYYDGDDSFCGCFLEYPNFSTRSVVDENLCGLNQLFNTIFRGWRKNYPLNKAYNLLAKYSCCSIYLGGSLFMQSTQIDGRRGVEIVSERMPAWPRFIIGANFGPYLSADYRDAHEAFFEKCAGVCFRDQRSYELFRDVESVSYAPDVVFNLDVFPYARNQSDKTVIISVIDMLGREILEKYAESYERFICDTCRYWVQCGKTPVLTSFCCYEGDEKVIARILEQLEPGVREKTMTHYYRGNIEDALSLFAGADYVVATRFHAMILALRFGKPFFSISYNDKIKQVLFDIGSDAYCEVAELEEIQVESVFKEYTAVTNAEEYIREADKQFAQLDRYLNRQRNLFR